jgi:hypothetical protein
MSVRVMAAVWEQSEAEGNDRLILLALADHADDETWSCWPSIARLAQKTRVSGRTVQRCLRKLEEIGEVATEARGGTASNREMRPNRYTITLGTPRQSDTPVNLTPGDTCVRGPGDNRVTTPVTTVSPEPSKNHQENHHLSREAFEDDFDELWQHYPRKVARKGALRSYQARRREGVAHADLLSAAIAYAASRRGQDEQYTLHGGTFLGSSERWREWDNGGLETGADCECGLVHPPGECPFHEPAEAVSP